MTRYPFPLPGIVGQEKLLTAYLANLVAPSIGGLLIVGPKGTGKSTTVHSAASILPEYDAVADCPFRCDPKRPDRRCSLCRARTEWPAGVKHHAMKVVTVPLSCTEDRLIGSLDVEKLLGEGRRDVQVGLLGEANRNLLYIDEVNLLPDHLVDDILDVAASHWNAVEREGISIEHPSEFVLVGTMNPEEGDLRPQILDRFPLCARIETVRDPELRAEIVRRNLAYEQSPAEFHALFEAEETALRGVVLSARGALPALRPTDEELGAVARACAELRVDGQRPDIVIVKAAVAMQALADAMARASAAADAPRRRDRIELEHWLLAAELALVHRTRDGGLLDPPEAAEIDAVFRRALSSVSGESSSEAGDASSTGPGSASSAFPSIRKDRGALRRLSVGLVTDGQSSATADTREGGSKKA